MAQEQTHVKCPACNHVLNLAESELHPGGHVVCPNCGEKLTVKRDAGLPPVEDVEKGEKLLSFCPICEEGKVTAAESEGDDRIYRCDTCESILKESIFGFGYGRLDPRFETRKSEYIGKYFTKPEIVAISDRIERSRKEFKPKKEHSQTAGKPAAQDSSEGSEFWWQLDQEELARRRAKAMRVKRDVTVDDLMDEIKRQGGER